MVQSHSTHESVATVNSGVYASGAPGGGMTTEASEYCPEEMAGHQGAGGPIQGTPGSAPISKE